jgi:hypothetical protein
VKLKENASDDEKLCHFEWNYKISDVKLFNLCLFFAWWGFCIKFWP